MQSQHRRHSGSIRRKSRRLEEKNGLPEGSAVSNEKVEMDNPSRRLFPRRTCRIPVRYQVGDESTFWEATVCNRSKTGLYLIAGELLPPQANIRIVIPADSPETADHREYPCYFGQTVWSRLLRKAPLPQTACGVHLLRRRDTAAGEDVRAI